MSVVTRTRRTPFTLFTIFPFLLMLLPSLPYEILRAALVAYRIPSVMERAVSSVILLPT